MACRFLLKDPKSYKTGQSVIDSVRVFFVDLVKRLGSCREVHSEARTLHGSFTFRLLVLALAEGVTCLTQARRCCQ